MSGFALIASTLFVHALVSRRLERTALTAPMLYTLAGLVLGPSALGLVHLELGSHEFLELGEIALVLLLFSDAARVDVRGRRGLASLPVRLLGIGMPLTIVLGAVLGVAVLGALSFQEAALLATIHPPTDAALGQAVVGNPRVPARIRQALNVEAGLNDGMSMPFLAVFLTMAEAEVRAQPFRVWLGAAGAQIGFGVLVGVVVGLAGGWLVREARERRWMTGTFMRLGLLALAIIAWLTADALGGNGFIAAFVAGLAVGYVVGDAGEALIEFTEADGLLLALAVFFVFGAIAGPLLQAMTWQVGLYAILSLTLIRMLPVALSLIGTRLHPASVLFVGWFGPRGLASVVLGLIVILDGPTLPGRDLIVTAVVATVLLSIVAHGLTSVPLSRSYARLTRALPEGAPEKRGAADLPTRLGHVEPPKQTPPPGDRPVARPRRQPRAEHEQEPIRTRKRRATT
jgi:NhaP-type Na+/H+ or K+/H+ antiporter